MNTSEARFKNIVNRLLDRGIYPGPTAINNARLGTHFGRSNNLNGRECQWRREVLEYRGWTYVNPFLSRRQKAWQL
jgi:hypothetical protein